MLRKKFVVTVRLLLGAQYFLSGLNWWVKILPFPSMSDPRTGPYKYEIARVMIETGWMFGLTKMIELATGLSLLLNVFAPLMLVASMSVAVTTFLMDAFIWQYISGWFVGTVTTELVVAKILDAIFFGGVVLAMQVYLMIAYLPYYKPMLVLKAEVREPATTTRLRVSVMTAFAVVAIVLGVLALGWFGLMMVQTLSRR